MPYVYLIRHPSTQPDPALPASHWWLSEAGRAQVHTLVNLPIWKGIATVYTSTQPKTSVVGELVYAAHGVPFVPLVALDEACRETWLDPEAFDAAQRAFFAHPADPPMRGWEPARSAGLRFIAAMDHLLAVHKLADSLVIVSHATVLTLYVAHLREITPSYEQWRKTGFAAIMAVDREELRPVTPFLAAPYDDLPMP